jgi:caffeoyl-CoA O-methyltransferase
VKETKELGYISDLQVAPDLATLLSILTHTCQPRFAVEVGTITGLSSLAIAEALPEGGRLLCCDPSEQYTAMARRYWHMAGVGDRVELAVAPAEETLAHLDEQVDFAFIDILHPRAVYDLLLTRLAPHGLIAVDNMTCETRGFVDYVKADEAVESVLLTLGGGLVLIRKRRDVE